MADSSGSGSAAGACAGAGPRWWTVVVPCLLRLPVSARGLLLGAVAGMSTAGGPGPGPMLAMGVGEYVVGVGAIGTVIAGLAWRAGRRMLRRVLWIGCLLACAGLGVMYAWAAAHR